MAPITIYLLWTLMAGQPVDVDAYITKDACLQVLAERTELLKNAKIQTRHPDLEKVTFVKCQPLEISVPKGV